MPIKINYAAANIGYIKAESNIYDATIINSIFQVMRCFIDEFQEVTMDSTSSSVCRDLLT